MKTVDVVFVGDLHFNGINNYFPNYSFDPNDLIFKALKKPLEYAREQAIDHVVFLGDLYDNPDPSQKLQRRFLKFLSEYSDLKFHIPAGNHDFLNNETVSLEMSEFATTISDGFKHVRFYTKPKLVWIEGVPFSFLPWPYCKTLHEPSVVVAHVEIKGSRSDNGKVFEKGHKLYIGSGFAVVGHLHQRQAYGQVFYPGNLFQKTFGERLPKGFLHSTIKYGKTLKYEHHYHEIKPPFELVNLRIEKPEDFGQVKLPDEKRIVQYKLMMRNGVEVPVGFLEKHPNVIEVSGKLSKRELSAMEQGRFTMDLADIETDMLDGLDDFLINEGLTPKQLKIANDIVRKHKEKLGV